MKTKTHRIVLTGGPGGGKTTAADLIRRELGPEIVVVPEAATMLFAGGFPRYEDLGAQVSVQKAIYHVQRNIEDVQHSRYPGRVLLCDRGTIDGAAYWPNGETDFFVAIGSELEKELTRYDAVIFFESAAVGDISIEGGNPARIESNRKAVELDRKLKAVWSRHPQFIHIPHQKSFLKKLQCAADALQTVLKGLGTELSC